MHLILLGLVLLAAILVAAYALRNRLLETYRAPLQSAIARAAGREITLKSVRLDAACRSAEVSAGVDVAPGWRLEVERARIDGLAALVRRDPAGVAVDVSAGVLTHEASGRSLRFSAQGRGSRDVSAGGAVELTVQVTEGATVLTLAGRAAADGALSSARCAGKVFSSLLETMMDGSVASFPAPFEVVVDGHVEGTLASPRVAATLFCPSLRVSDRATPHHLTAALSDATAKVRWEPGMAVPEVDAFDAGVELTGPAGTLTGTFAARAREVPREGHLVRLAASLTGARFVPRRPPAAPWTGIEARAHVDVRPDGWSLQDVSLGCRGATLAGALCGPFGGMAWMSVKLDGLDAPTLRDLLRHVPGGPELRVMAAGAPPGGFPVPPDLRVSGQIAPGPDGLLACSFTLDTDTSRLFLNGRPEVDAPIGWKLSGRLSPRDVNVMGWFAPVRLDPEGEIFLDMKIEGGPLRLVGPAQSARLEVRGYADAALAPVPVTDISAQLEAGGDEMKWKALQGTLYGGTVTCNGWMGFTSDPFPYVVRVDWTGVAAGQMPMGPGGDRLAQHLKATASGTLTVEGRGSDPALIKGTGEVTLADPKYAFLAQLAPMLEPYGLPAPPINGSAPGRAELVLGDRKLTLRHIDVRVPGVEVTGSVLVSFAGALAGNLEIDLDRQYLSRSALLSLPASFAKTLRIPATLSGTVTTPRWSADVTGSLGHFMKNYELGDITKGILENYELGSLTKGVFDVLRHATGGAEKRAPGAEMDRILEHILTAGPRTDQYLAQLRQAGYTTEDIRNMISDYSRRAKRS